MASLTWDRGMELAAHKTFAVATDVRVYFLRSPEPLAARLEREHERPLAAVFPGRNRPLDLHAGASEHCGAAPQHAPAKDAWLRHASE